MKVKVIKKGEKAAQVLAKEKSAARPRDAARELVGQVAGWVTDFQARKRAETRAAVDSLFNGNPKPSES